MLNPVAGKYQITEEASRWMQRDHGNYYYAIINQKNGKSFINPTVSIKRGKEAAFGTQARLSTWIETDRLVKVE